MKVLIAPDKFKGSLTALEACQAIEAGILRFDPTIRTVLLPMADGGEGSIDLLSRYVSAIKMDTLVKDPLGRSIEASYLLDGSKAYIEMAKASGLDLLTIQERNPLYTSSFGTGELMLDAISHGATDIYLFVGGSATNDMGIGIAQALGYRFLDRDGDEVPPVGLSLAFIMKMEHQLKYDIEAVNFYAVCDVDNPLYGKDGAAHIYGRQKGGDKYAIEILDKGLRKLSKKCKKYLDKEVSKVAGTGAAGGAGGGVLAFLDGQIISGVDFLLNMMDFERHLGEADLVITGEGCIDEQTLRGKVVNGIINCNVSHQKSIYLLCGSNNLDRSVLSGLDVQEAIAVIDLAKDKQDAMDNAGDYLEQMSYALISTFQ